jgi:hypothetical protein
MICYKILSEPMKIMNISSPLRTLPKLLALLIALTCTPPLIHAKVGEQENWYVAKELELDSVPQPTKYFKDPANGKEYVIGLERISVVKLDLEGNIEKYFFPLEPQFDASALRSYPINFDIFAGGNIILLYEKKTHYLSDDRTYHIAYGTLVDGLITAITIDSPGNYHPSQSGDGRIPITLSGGTLHPDNEIEGSELSPTGFAYTTSTLHSTASPLKKITLNSVSPRYLSPPSVNINAETVVEEASVTVNLGMGYRFQELEETFSSSESGGNQVHISTDGHIYITKSVRESTNEWGPVTFHMVKVYTLDTESNPSDPSLSLVKSFKLYPGTAPGQINGNIYGITATNDNILLSDGDYLNYYSSDGTFIKRVVFNGSSLDLSQTNQILTQHGVHDIEGRRLISNNSFIGGDTAMSGWVSQNWTKDGDIAVVSYFEGNYGGTWSNKYFFQKWKRAYRTKGLPTHNVIPQPVVRSITQRAGTNILDIDFEIIDPDDDTATAGILGTIAIEDGINDWGEYQNNSHNEFNDLTKLIVPSSLTDGTDALIGQPIATNEMHRVSWYVKGDWSELTGDLKVGVFAQDARRSMPVDLHFLKIPTEDGNLTISRSPLKDSDILNYFQYLLSIGDPRVSLNDSKIVDSSGITLVGNTQGRNHQNPSTKQGRDFFMNDLGYRWASIAELSIAREAATPGTVNSWDATNQVKPRNLPNRVNEYGFDTGNHGTRAWWVVKESSLEIPVFTSLVLDNNGTENEGFGEMVSISNNQVLIGRKDATNYYERKAYYFESSEDIVSIQSEKIVEPEDNGSIDFSNYFGIGKNTEGVNLDIDSNIAAIPALFAYKALPNGDVDHNTFGAGAVFLFDLSSGTPSQIQRVAASDGSEYDFFGNAIDLDGDLLVIGAHSDDPGGVQDSGSAYLFKKSSSGLFEQTAKLIPEDSFKYMHFGHSVAVMNNRVAIGGNYGSEQAVYLYSVSESGEPSLTQKIQRPGDRGGHFGYDLAMIDQWLVIGSNDGAHLFKINSNGNAELATSIYSPRDQYFTFGLSVAIDGDRLVIGAPGEDSDNGSQSGVVYVYQILEDGKVRLLESLIHPTGKANDQFGLSVSISGLNILVGAPGYDLDNDRWNAGSAVLFRASQ